MGSKNLLFCSFVLLVVFINNISCEDQENDDKSDLLAMESQNVRLDYDNQVLINSYYYNKIRNYIISTKILLNIVKPVINIALKIVHPEMHFQLTFSKSEIIVKKFIYWK